MKMNAFENIKGNYKMKFDFFFANLQNEPTFSKVKVSTLRCIEISKVRKPSIKVTKKTMKI
jgi:hypothetical protein